MTRYIRLYLYFLRFSISKAFEFRFDFFFRIGMDTVYYAVNLAFFQVIYRHTNLLAGWSEAETMVFVAGYLMLDALNMVIFSSNMWMFPFYINRGDLDYYLTRPVSTLFFLSLREVAINSAVNLLMTVGIMAWALMRLEEPVTFGAVALFLVLIVNGTLLHFLLQMLFLIPVFWTHSAEGLRTLFFASAAFGERPDRIYQGPVRLILTTVLPFALMASFPARLLLDGFSWEVLGHLVAVTAAFAAAVGLLWRLGLRNYSSASS